MGSTDLSSSTDDHFGRQMLSSPNSNADHIELELLAEEKFVTRDLSFSSSSDGENDDENNNPSYIQIRRESNNSFPFGLVQKLNESINESARYLFTSVSNISQISASANTTIMSNRKAVSRESDNRSPPPFIIAGEESCEEAVATSRSIFGNQTHKKYNVRREIHVDQANAAPLQSNTSGTVALSANESLLGVEFASPGPLNAATYNTPPRLSQTKKGNAATTAPNNPPLDSFGYIDQYSPPLMSPLTPARMYWGACRNIDLATDNTGMIPQLNSPDTKTQKSILKFSEENGAIEKASNNFVHFDQTMTGDAGHDNYLNPSNTIPPIENHHAQAFLLSLAFFFLWTPQNLLAPSLTEAAHDFGYDDERDRDLYLGSNLALVSVVCLPLSAGIGVASDFVSSRKTLVSITALVGGLAAIGTSVSVTYPQLLLSRFIGGACMSGSVPVVFSLLSDWFHETERNAASSFFTAMMGGGIIAGQVYAGCAGPTQGWRLSFYNSGIVTIVFAVLTMITVRDPIRGGKERVLRELMAKGKTYDRKLTLQTFIMAFTKNSSNCLLMLQGFTSNLPLGVMFVFMNDYLSQGEMFVIYLLVIVLLRRHLTNSACIRKGTQRS